MVAAFVVGVLVLPVSRTVRWWIVLLAGLSWPFVYAIKLGQVGPLLFLTFAVGWRWLDDPVRLGASAAIGSARQAAARARLRLGGAHRSLAGGRHRRRRPRGPRRRGHRCWPGRPPGRTSCRVIRTIAEPDHDPEQRDAGRGRLPGRALDGGRDGDPDRERRGVAGRRGRRRRASRDRRGRLPRRRSSRASSSRRSCGTTTRCCCSCRSPICSPPAAGGRSPSRS